MYYHFCWFYQCVNSGESLTNLIFGLYTVCVGFTQSVWALHSLCGLYTVCVGFTQSVWALHSLCGLYTVCVGFTQSVWALHSLWVIRRSIHIDKIHKNKIHSYNILFYLYIYVSHRRVGRHIVFALVVCPSVCHKIVSTL